ncbi:MAG: hypothetical protein Q7R81_01120 [Candidatus Peregrinibacteria bacterium]|nr:hypothetical protein [Candidatus Peregrinibacteria bacterium]
MRHLSLLVLSLLLLAACAKEQTIKIDIADSTGTGDDIIGQQTVKAIMPKGGKVIDPEHGEEVFFALAPLIGVGGANANGVTQIQVFADGTLLHTMQLNIDIPEKGTYYEAWLEDGATGDRVSTGHLSNHFGDVRHQLKGELDRDLRDHLKVVVTLEKDDGNPDPSQPVAEALLKIIDRKAER